jgi:hypothetical protein
MTYVVISNEIPTNGDPAVFTKKINNREIKSRRGCEVKFTFTFITVTLLTNKIYLPFEKLF